MSHKKETEEERVEREEKEAQARYAQQYPDGTYPPAGTPGTDAVVGDQLTHPVAGGTFAQALRAVRDRNATVICSMNNRPVIKLDQIALQSTEWFIVDPLTGAVSPVMVEDEELVE